MKQPETDFYEKYWQVGQGEAAFQDIPVWGNIEDLNKMIKFFRSAIKGKILDAGCGLGDWVFHLAKFEEVSEVIGVDISKTAIKKCIKKSKESKFEDKTKFIATSLTELPFSNNSLDSIFSLEVVEHVFDVESMFSQFNRVLKKGGYLGISTVDFNLLKEVIIGIFFFEKYFDPRSPHIRFFTKNTLRKLLEKNGFKIERYRWTGSYFGIMPMGQMVIAKKVNDI